MKQTLIVIMILLAGISTNAQTASQRARSYVDSNIGPNGKGKITGQIHHASDSMILDAVDSVQHAVDTLAARPAPQPVTAINGNIKIGNDIIWGGALSFNTAVGLGGRILNFGTPGSSGTGELTLAPTFARIGSPTGNITVNATGMTVLDGRTTKKGLEYASNYAAGYSARSLTDRGYVDSSIAASLRDSFSYNDVCEYESQATTKQGFYMTRFGAPGTCQARGSGPEMFASVVTASDYRDSVRAFVTADGPVAFGVDAANTIGGNVAVRVSSVSGLSVSSASPDGNVAHIGGGNGVSYLGSNDGISGTSYFRVRAGGVEFEDLRSLPRGMEYKGNYRATFSDSSLVDKGYVDSVLNGVLVVADTFGIVAVPGTDYVLTGDAYSDAFVLPAISSVKPGRASSITFINRGLTSMPITAAGGFGEIYYNGTPTESVAVQPGESFTLLPDGTYWITMRHQ